jgi:hypothetical protein
MAFTNLHVAEFTGLGATEQGDSIDAFSAEANIANQTVAIGGSSAKSAAFQSANPAAFSGTPNQSNGAQIAGTKWVRLYADIACSVAFGPQASVSAAVGGWYMPAASSLLVRVPANLGWAVACIADTT